MNSNLVVFCDSPPDVYRLGYHEVLIRASTLIQTANELLPLNFFNIRHFYLFHSTYLSILLGPWYWYHHLRNLLQYSTRLGT